MKIAIIDIGTNSFILLIAEVYHGSYRVINQFFEIPRLGANLLIDGKISDKSIQSAINSLSKFRNIIEEQGVELVLPIATAVLREAANAKEVTEILSRIINSEIKIISGEEEAELSFVGAIDNDEDNIVVDVGGGSTEISYGRNQQIIHSKSFPIGAAKIKSKFFQNSINEHIIANAIDFVKSTIIFEYYFDLPSSIVAVGGTITTLAYILKDLKKYDADKINNTIISYSQNWELFDKLKKMDATEISERYGIHPKRADILLSGQLIYLTIQEILKYTKIKVSTQGLRYGVLKKYLLENS